MPPRWIMGKSWNRCCMFEIPISSFRCILTMVWVVFRAWSVWICCWVWGDFTQVLVPFPEFTWQTPMGPITMIETPALSPSGRTIGHIPSCLGYYSPVVNTGTAWQTLKWLSKWSQEVPVLLKITKGTFPISSSNRQKAWFPPVQRILEVDLIGFFTLAKNNGTLDD